MVFNHNTLNTLWTKTIGKITKSLDRECICQAFFLQLVICNILYYSSELFMGIDYLLHNVFGSVYGLSFNLHKKWVTIVCFILPLPIETVPGKVTQEKEFQNWQFNSPIQRMETNHSTHRYWYGKVLNIPHNSSDMHALQSIRERDGSKTWSVILNKQLNSVSWDKDKTPR